ncbi:MAG: CinA family protein [Gammaproteobacteria bacterium]|nr:CinA family protein [Gammaproteobacteria bacterium]
MLPHCASGRWNWRRKAGQALLAAGLKLVTAESCTGGMIAEWVTRIPGSSDWFERSLVTYSNESKQELLGVSKATLEKHGAVSEETAAEMATGALNASHADIAVAVTGIAGPDGGTRAKPVGTVCMAWAVQGGHVYSVRVQLKGDRQAIRRQSAALALEGVIDRAAAGKI